MKDRSLPRLGAACGIFSVVLEIAGIGVSVVSAPELVDATLGSSEEEIARVTSHWAKQGEPDFDISLLEDKSADEMVGAADGEFSPDQDDLLADAARIVVESETASVSMIQRRLRVGYTRAGRLIDMLERRGIISGYEGSKPRQVLVSMSELPALNITPPEASASPTVPSGEGALPGGRP